MSFTPTERALLESQRETVTPQIVLRVEGLSTVFGAVEILRLIKVGDDGLLIGDDWQIGGLTAIEDQEDAIKLEGSSSKIQQQIEPDKGSVSSVSSVQVSLIDFNNVVTGVISPGVVLSDILGRKADLLMGFQNTAFPDDYIPVFSGIIDDVESFAGEVRLNIAHPEQKKRQSIFQKIDTTLAAPIDADDSTLVLSSVTGIGGPLAGVNGLDPDLTHYVRIGDEVIQFSAVSGVTLTGCTRGAFDTTASAHAAGDGVSTFFSLEGNAIGLALKLMLSGKNGPWVEDLGVESFLAVDGEGDGENAIFFRGLDIEQEYGVSVGDFATVTGAANGANNVTLTPIVAVERVDGGSYIVLDDTVTLVRETDSAAVIALRSQFDSLGYGLAMDPDEVDVAEHIYWRDLVLADLDLKLFLKDTINGKSFLDSEIYAPIGAFSIPRKGRCSMGYHLGPVPRDELQILDASNVKRPGKIKLRRSINKNFYNTIVFSADEDVLEDKFLAGFIYQDADSTGRIPVGVRALKLQSRGMRTDLDAANQTRRIADRMLNRYRFGAEYVQGLEIFFKTGWALEPGDLVLFDPSELQVSNTLDGTRVKPVKPWEVVNKTLDLKTGAVTIDIIDTNYDMSERYGVISPSSLTDSGCTTTSLKLQDSFGDFFPNNEGRKWEQYVGLPVRVHSQDYAFDEEVELTGVDEADPRLIYVEALSAPPPADYVVDIGDFPNTSSPADNALYKALHAAFIRAAVVSATGSPATTVFTLGAGEAADLQAGDKVRVYSADFADDSGEVEVESVAGDVVTLSEALSFSVTTTHRVDVLVFPDRSGPYRIV